jgi:hypothetical protein
VLDTDRVRSYGQDMKLSTIIDIIIRTPSLEGKRIYLAALVARDGHADAIAEVASFWINQGGCVESDIEVIR